MTGGTNDEAIAAIRGGDVAALAELLAREPALAVGRSDGERTLLHVATDWPGHFPRVGESIAVLVRHGADIDAPFHGRHAETPLHWAASADDLEALDALLDLGAAIEAPGSVIDGGAALSDAVAFGCWRAAQRLVERGASSTMWQSAALGLTDRLEACFEREANAGQAEVTKAFWCACHGGHFEAARFLLARGAKLNWVGYDRLTPLGVALRHGNEALAAWLREQGAES